MERDEANAAKRELCEKLLVPGTVMLVIDARRPGVSVPPHLTGDPKLRLNIDYRFGSAMTVDDWGIAATLSFGGVEFDCVLPWESIYVFMPHTSSQPYVFPDDVPNEVLDEIGVEAPAQQQRPALRLVTEPGTPAESEAVTPADHEAEPATAPADSDPDPEPPPVGKRRGHLRVVK